MAHRLTRPELYDLVWALPITKLSKRYGFSDRGFAKLCQRAKVPVRPQGYWARLQAGQPVSKLPLPNRGPGTIGALLLGDDLKILSDIRQDAARDEHADDRHLGWHHLA